MNKSYGRVRAPLWLEIVYIVLISVACYSAFILYSYADVDILVGGGISESWMISPTRDCHRCDRYDLQERREYPAAFIELRRGNWGIELTHGRAQRRADATANSAEVGDVNISQVIDAAWHSVQGTYTHNMGKFDLHLGLGYAFIDGNNHEYGTYHYYKESVDHENATHEKKPIIIGGLDYKLPEQFFIRTELTHMNHTVESYWTRHSEINTIAVMIGKRF